MLTSHVPVSNKHYIKHLIEYTITKKRYNNDLDFTETHTFCDNITYR